MAAFDKIQLPITSAVLPRSIWIKAGVYKEIDYTKMTATTFTGNTAPSLSTIGAINKIDIKQNVDLAEWRQFDSSFGGMVFEWVPTKETISFTLDGIILYSGDVPGRLNSGSKNFAEDFLFNQIYPFVIEIVENKPVISTQTGSNEETIGYQTRSTWLVGCRIKNRPFVVNIESAEIIKQTIDGNATRIIRSSWTTRTN